MFMISNKMRLVAASLTGALAVHVALAACSDESAGSSASSGGVAHAQTSPSQPACLQWQVQGFMPKSYAQATIPYPNPDSPPDNVVVRPVVEAFDLPEGWEPFAGDSFGSILARQCIKPAL